MKPLNQSVQTYGSLLPSLRLHSSIKCTHPPPLEIIHCAPTHNKYRKSPLNNAAWLWTDKAGVDKTSQASKELRLKLASRCVWVAINKIHQPLVTRIFILEINVTCLQSFVMWLLFLTVWQFEKQVNRNCVLISSLLDYFHPKQHD